VGRLGYPFITLILRRAISSKEVLSGIAGSDKMTLSRRNFLVSVAALFCCVDAKLSLRPEIPVLLYTFPTSSRTKLYRITFYICRADGTALFIHYKAVSLKTLTFCPKAFAEPWS
jgi:hypothetical protein